MLHHISFPTADIERASEFYDAVLIPLGYERVFTHRQEDGFIEAAVGWDLSGGEGAFAIRQRLDGVPESSDAFHLAFSAPSREAVDAFHAAALAHGGRDNGGTGIHPEYGDDYYAAYVFDLDGHRIEAKLA